MTTFWRLLEESVIVQGVVTVGLAGACVYLALAGREIPDALLAMTTTALGFYFGSKGQLTGRQAARAAIQQLEREK